MILDPNFGSWYALTLPIVCVENLIMGITLLLLCTKKGVGRFYHRIGIICFAISMLTIGLFNLFESLFGECGLSDDTSLALVIFAASVQLFIFLCAFISMLDPTVITLRRIGIELLLILLFTVPALVVSPTKNPIWFDILFVFGLAFYVVKLIFNVYLYKKSLRKAISEIEHYHSCDSSTLLTWINHTFYITMIVAVASVIVPMTDFTILTLYNMLIFVAYFYIYAQIIRNIHIFDDSMRTIGEGLAPQTCDDFSSDDNPETVEKSIGSFLLGREKVYDDWLAGKAYCKPNITADTIAAQLNTNRNRLSHFLKNEKNMNYYEWIALLRVQEAKRLLTDYPELPVSEIALRVGIEDKSNFGRIFKRIEGTSPALYRRAYFAASGS